MADAARQLHGQADPATTYTTATSLAVSGVAGCQAASLSLVRRRRTVENVAATDPVLAVADELQTELGEGPCTDAITQDPVTHSASLAYDLRWPTWGPRVAAETGLQSVLSLRLFTHTGTLGALTLYSRAKCGFSIEDVIKGQALAAHVAVAVIAAEELDHLDAALASRTVIGQATGILVERFHLTPDVAFTVLARVSSSQETKIRHVAEILVRTGRLPGPDPTPAGGTQ